MMMRVTIGQACGADPVLGLAQLVAGVKRGFGLRQAGARAEAGRTEPVGRDRAQRVELGALMGAAQGFADQPADIVELLIVRCEQAVGAHRVERVENAAQPLPVANRRLAGLPGAGQALGSCVEPLLNRIGDILRRPAGILGFGSGDSDHLTSSAQRRAGEVQ